jgi:hypothetical protein
MSSSIDLGKFIEDVSHIPSFSISEYSSRLRAAILAAPQMSKVAGYFKLADEDKVHGQNDCHFGNVDCTDKVNRLGVATAAVVLSQFADARGFSGLADGVRIEAQRALRLFTDSVCSERSRSSPGQYYAGAHAMAFSRSCESVIAKGHVESKPP